MRRRDFLTVLGGAAAWPRPLRAQQVRQVIGILGLASGPGEPWMAPFYQGLGETGYVEGKNLAIEYRVAEFHYDRFPALATDLVGRNVNVIVTGNGTTSALAAKSATATIPIVFIRVYDSVGLGLVASLARPGGNATGFAVLTVELMAKRLGFLTELVPQARVIALLVNPTSSISESIISNVQIAARAKGLELLVLKAASEGDIDVAFTTLVQQRAGALVISPDRFFIHRGGQLGALASRHAIPAIAVGRAFVTAGGLISYADDETGVFRQAGIYVGRILKGAKPADLPVQQSTKFKLLINLKTAKALGITIPPSLLAGADEVIE